MNFFQLPKGTTSHLLSCIQKTSGMTPLCSPGQHLMIPALQRPSWIMERPAELCLMILTTGPVSTALRKGHVGVFGSIVKMQFVTQWQNYWEEGEVHPRNGDDIQLGSSCKELCLWNEEEYHTLQLLSVTPLLKDGHIPKLNVHNTLLRRLWLGRESTWTVFWLLKVEVFMFSDGMENRLPQTEGNQLILLFAESLEKYQSLGKGRDIVWVQVTWVQYLTGVQSKNLCVECFCCICPLLLGSMLV